MTRFYEELVLKEKTTFIPRDWEGEVKEKINGYFKIGPALRIQSKVKSVDYLKE